MTTVASVFPQWDGATVTLSCGHILRLAALDIPAEGADQFCWQCERDLAGRVAA